MKKTSKIFFAIAVVLALVLAACGAAVPTPMSNASLAIAPNKIDTSLYPKEVSDLVWFRDMDVQPPDQFGRYCIANCFGVGDPILIKMEDGMLKFFRNTANPNRESLTGRGITYEAATPSEILIAERTQATLLGRDINQIWIDADNITVVSLDKGPGLDTYMRYYGTPERVEIAKQAIKDLCSKLYENGVGPMDIQFKNFSIEMDTGIVSMNDFGHVAIKGTDGVGFSQWPFSDNVTFQSYLDNELETEGVWWLTQGELADEPLDKPSAIPTAVNGKSKPSKIGEEMEPNTGVYIVGECRGNWCPYYLDDFDGSWYKNLYQDRIGFQPGLNSVSVERLKQLYTTQAELAGLSTDSVQIQTLAGTSHKVVTFPNIGYDLDSLYSSANITDAEVADAFWEARQIALRLYVEKKLYIDMGTRQARLKVFYNPATDKVFLQNLSGAKYAGEAGFPVEDISIIKSWYSSWSQLAISELTGKTISEVPIPPYPDTVNSISAANTAIPPVINSASEALPAETKITRLVDSTIDGKTYQVSLTDNEWKNVFSGSDDAIKLMEGKIPLPSSKGWQIVGKIAGEGLVLVGTAAAIYAVTNQIALDAGIGNNYQFGWFEFQPYITPVDPGTMTSEALSRYEQFAPLWGDTALFRNYYDIRTMNDRHLSFPMQGGCQTLSLNEPSSVGIPTLLTDKDVILDGFQCDNGNGEIVFGNFAGDKIVWSLQSVSATENAWVLVEGPNCLTLNGTVRRTSGETFATQFELCTTNDGLDVKPMIFK